MKCNNSSKDFKIHIDYPKDLFDEYVEKRPERAQGIIRIRIGDKYIIGEESEDWGIVEFLIPHFTELLQSIPKIHNEEKIKIHYKSTPGHIIIEAANRDKVKIQTHNEESGLVNKDTVVKEIIKSSDDIYEKISQKDYSLEENRKLRKFHRLLVESKRDHTQFE
jgi:hypothetical protein